MMLTITALSILLSSAPSFEPTFVKHFSSSLFQGTEESFSEHGDSLLLRTPPHLSAILIEQLGYDPVERIGLTVYMWHTDDEIMIHMRHLLTKVEGEGRLDFQASLKDPSPIMHYPISDNGPYIHQNALIIVTGEGSIVSIPFTISVSPLIDPVVAEANDLDTQFDPISVVSFWSGPFNRTGPPVGLAGPVVSEK